MVTVILKLLANVWTISCPILLIVLYGESFDTHSAYFINISTALLIAPFILMGSDFDFIKRLEPNHPIKVNILSIFLLVSMLIMNFDLGLILALIITKRLISISAQAQQRPTTAYIFENSLVPSLTLILFATNHQHNTLLFCITIFSSALYLKINHKNYKVILRSEFNNSSIEILNSSLRQLSVQIPTLLYALHPFTSLLTIKLVQSLISLMTSIVAPSVISVRKFFQENKLVKKTHFFLWINSIIDRSLIYLALPILFPAIYLTELYSMLHLTILSSAHILFLILSYASIMLIPPFNIILFSRNKSHYVLAVQVMSVTFGVLFGYTLRDWSFIPLVSLPIGLLLNFFLTRQ